MAAPFENSAKNSMQVRIWENRFQASCFAEIAAKCLK